MVDFPTPRALEVHEIPAILEQYRWGLAAGETLTTSRKWAASSVGDGRITPAGAAQRTTSLGTPSLCTLCPPPEAQCAWHDPGGCTAGRRHATPSTLASQGWRSTGPTVGRQTRLPPGAKAAAVPGADVVAQAGA